ncbi:hypothetical protein GEMRC1_001497 [Eukaryota sp. GEM-RC1]
MPAPAFKYRCTESRSVHDTHAPAHPPSLSTPYGARPNMPFYYHQGPHMPPQMMHHMPPQMMHGQSWPSVPGYSFPFPGPQPSPPLQTPSPQVTIHEPPSSPEIQDPDAHYREFLSTHGVSTDILDDLDSSARYYKDSIEKLVESTNIYSESFETLNKLDRSILAFEWAKSQRIHVQDHLDFLFNIYNWKEEI